MASLPPEVKATIIDLLKDTESTDSSCREYGALSLLWSDVLFRIREHRFRIVNLKNLAKVRLLLEIIQGVPSGTLVWKVKVGPDLRVFTAARATLYTSPNLPLLFAALSRVTSISLADLGPSNIHLVHSLPPTVTDVYLYISNITIDDILENLVAFPALESLEIRGYWGSEGRAALQRNLAHFTALRRLDIDADILVMPALLERVMSPELFPNVECLIIRYAAISSQRQVWHLDQLLRKWDATLKDIHLPRPLRSIGKSFPFFNACVTLPAALESMYFDICLTGGKEVADDDHLTFFTRALEARRRAGRTLKSLRIGVQFDHADPQDPMLRRFDEVVSSPELGLQHLEWNIHCYRRGDGANNAIGICTSLHAGLKLYKATSSNYAAVTPTPAILHSVCLFESLKNHCTIELVCLIDSVSISIGVRIEIWQATTRGRYHYPILTAHSQHTLSSILPRGLSLENGVSSSRDQGKDHRPTRE
ncbi:hypothetical protein CYLTODRAFT_470656 [Cylindrobasidium torrendii FP15055 ss-10]|uniref:F-box domain-containing protein n=1 Tax=Cylindrobasidium torrendii FP15055 ss-10 TaxID=1314674 RepID=A0A0D7B0R8_9AGAR|nr:hypothetical protein CYLTODRAFT_470656 [Cylindrobasidium torrendii FP15055 ss-10]